jgi:thiosulfate dehydrogenase [quinone] large subunit
VTPYVLGRALLPLRAFLGFTFCFAGLQKLANPRFFDAADPASIQSQLAGAAHRSPIHALIAPLGHVAVPLGILIAFGELEAAAFTDPATGDPSIVIRPRSATFVAFDAVCPHAGCTVGYDPSAKVIVCPCHGSQFNASTGAVEVGPAPTGLTKLGIAEGPNGQLYVT